MTMCMGHAASAGEQSRMQLGVKSLDVHSANLPHKSRCAVNGRMDRFLSGVNFVCRAVAARPPERHPACSQSRRSTRRCASAMSSDVEAIA